MKAQKKQEKSKKSYRKMAITSVVLLGIAVLAYSFAFSNPVSDAKYGSFRPEMCKSLAEEGGGAGNCIIPEVFQNLPPYPKDLSDIYELVYFSRLNVPENFSTGISDENYYLQPEFYATWKTTGLQFYQHLRRDKTLSGDYLYKLGYGAYPGDQVIKVAKGGGFVDVVSYWHASWGIVTWQGMKLVPIFPEKGNIGNVFASQNPEMAKKYFSVEISPDTILFEPTYPVFQKNWAYKIKTRINIDANTPAGNYIIGLVPSTPDPATEDKWLRQYKLGYMSVGSIGVSIGRPTQQIIISVE